MTTIDYVFIGLVVMGAVTGFAKGLLKQVATLVGLVAGFFIAKTLYVSVAEQYFTNVTDNMTWAQAMAFGAIWLLVPLACMLVAALLTGFLNALSLGWVNKLLGLVGGIVITTLTISIFLNVIDAIDAGGWLIAKTTKADSALYYPIKDLISWLFPAVREIAEPLIMT